MSVKIQFTIEDEEFGCEQTICMDGVTEFNANQVVSGDTTFAYEYTGRHDTGVLPQLKSSGPLAMLISNLKGAKTASDEFLSQKVNLKYGYTGVAPNGKGRSCPPPPTSSLEKCTEDDSEVILENETKRPKLDDADS